MQSFYMQYLIAILGNLVFFTGIMLLALGIAISGHVLGIIRDNGSVALAIFQDSLSEKVFSLYSPCNNPFLLSYFFIYCVF